MEENNGKFQFSALFKGEHRSFFYTVLVVLAIAVILLMALPGNNVFTWIKAGRDTARMEKSLREVVHRTDSIQKRIDDLRTNPDSLERYARESYSYTAPGEEVFVLED